MDMQGKKVRCIDIDGLSEKTSITMGTVYTVKCTKASFDNNKLYVLEEYPGEAYYARHFEPVLENVPVVCAEVVDEEARLRAIFTAPRAGECKCGMPKDQCTYHRDASGA